MNIVLLGYRGTGKSVIGRLLSHRLKRPLYSLDQMIVEKAGMPIPEIVARFGWPRFREMEGKMVEEVCSKSRDAIIDCGGGVILSKENMDLLKQDGRAVLLTAEFKVLMDRLKNDSNRPPLMENASFEQEQAAVMAKREEKYRAAADFTCDTTSDTPEDTADTIITHFRGKGWVT